MSSVKTEIRAELYGPDGKLLKRFPWKRANSLLKGFIQILAAQMSNANQVITDTGNVARTAAAHTSNLFCNAAADATTYGILIGTGTTAVAMTDYKLETQVTANIGFGASSIAVENPSASSWRIAISRGFTNNTGTDLEVKETAIYAYFSVTAYKICIDRTLYSVSVPNGVTLTLTYRITVTL